MLAMYSLEHGQTRSYHVDVSGLCHRGTHWSLWSCCSLVVMLMSVVHVTTEGQVDIYGLCCHLGSCWYPWSRLPLETITMSVVHIAPETLLMSLVCAINEGYGGVCGLSCGRGLCWCPWFELPLETMLKFVAHAVVRNHVEVYDPCSHWPQKARKLVLQRVIKYLRLTSLNLHLSFHE